LLLGFLALLALIGASLVLTNRTIGELQRDQQRITDLQAVRLELEALLRTYVDAETGQRGYLLTGDEKFLEPYTAARERLETKDARLKAMFGNEAELATMREELNGLGVRKLAELEARIAERQTGDPATVARGMQNGEGKVLMDEMRQRAAVIDRREAEEVTRVLARAQKAQRWTVLWTTGSAAIVSAALVALYFLTRRTLLELEAARQVANRLLAAERAAHSEAAQANRLKDEFLALVSHELRTPLNAMLGWTSLLKEGAEDEKELREGLETIDRNARAQARLVDDLLDVSRIIAGKVRLEITEVNLRAVTASVIDALRPAAEARGVKVQLHATSEPADVLGDADRLQQVVWNLLSNAIKFTPRGGRVSLALEHFDSRVVLAVADTGPGIAAEFLPHIFKRFSQGDPSTTRGHGGLGLGLAITRHLVELHGGRISAESAGEGQGATFRVEIPVVAVKELKKQLADRLGRAEELRTEAPGGADIRLDGRRVLAVDDQPDTLAVVNRVLTRAGAEVRTAGSATEGLSILGAWRPDLLISDVGMPGQDGYSFIRAVRAGGGKRLPALALTAFAREADRKTAIDAGFDEHLAKPVDAGALLHKVAEALGKG
jgi:signal transduction histidine kinase